MSNKRGDLEETHAGEAEIQVVVVVVQAVVVDSSNWEKTSSKL